MPRSTSRKSASAPVSPGAFAVLLRQYRTAALPRLSIRALARQMGASASYLAALEAGTVQSASVRFVEKITVTLGLPSADAERLREALRGDDPLIAPGVDVEPQKALERQCQEDVREVWVFAERPPELNEDWGQQVVANIKQRQVRHVYFLPSCGVWELALKPFFLEHLGEQLLRERILAIEIRHGFLQPFLFRPPGLLMVGEAGPVVGVWAKCSGNGEEMEHVYQMDAASLTQRYDTLMLIIRAMRKKKEMDFKEPMGFCKIFT